MSMFIVTRLILWIRTIWRFMRFGIVDHFLYILVILSNKTLTPEANRKVRVSFSDGSRCTPARKAVCRLRKVRHVSQITCVVFAFGILVVDKKFHVGT